MFSEMTVLYKNKFLSLFGRMQCCPNKGIYIRALSQELFSGLNETCKFKTEQITILWNVI